MRHIAYVEIAVGLGLGIGPLIGGFLYGRLDYEYTMYCFGGLNLFTMAFIIYYIPSSLNETASEEEIAELNIKV
jgi:MFS family permease